MHENWSGNIIKSTLLKPCENGYRIEYQSIVDRDGNDVDCFFGESAREFGKMWFSAKEAYEAIDAKRKRNIEKYTNEIQTIEDLIRFPLKYCINGEEYTNHAALEAYKQRAEEIFGEYMLNEALEEEK